jgi:NAD(P)-dependent dehydrogenase (short-subunit alcohol dehydrogenase family)
MTPARFDLTGKVAVITGGAGILGRHFSRSLAEAGATVCIVDKEACAELTAEIARGTGQQAYFFTCNVADPKDVSETVGRIVSTCGRIDILHNNAAAKSSNLEAFFAPFEEFSLETWREVMSVNIDGMFLVAQAVGKQMIAQGGGGSIIQTASIYGIVAPDQRIYQGSEYNGRSINTPAVYSASKAAVVGLTNYLATYWASHNIRVNTLTPGGIESGQNEEFKRRYSNRVPLERMGSADELTGALLFLASDASSYVTGHNLIVDGGLSVW